MQDRFKRMDCFILAAGKTNDFAPDGETTRLEKGYRRYAALFERVGLVLEMNQATERYLNYPHVCHQDESGQRIGGIAAALEEARSDAVFIGHSAFAEFPLELAFDLVKKYNGEPFLGYQAGDDSQPLFGIYHKQLAPRLKEALQEGKSLNDILSEKGSLLPLPEQADAAHIGLE